jgi:5'-3' exoribonuclease 2
MGVPKFFRWLSERYPKINQRFGSPPETETSQQYFGKPPPEPFEPPDPMARCTRPPEIDRLYLDMNGIIHGCSHNNSAQEDTTGGDDDGEVFDTVSKISNDEIFTNVCYYLDRVIGDMVQPTELVYMAIDGVAPRAKLNQQRSRRYRSGREGQIETSIYDAHVHKIQRERQQERQIDDPRGVVDDGYSFVLRDDDDDEERVLAAQDDDASPIQEISPGRFKGKFMTESQLEDQMDKEAFHSNIITPGTPFFQEFTQHLEHFVKYKLSTDPKWKHLTIIFSGPNVPGEGEHKIMQFIREQKCKVDYNPNLRHCIMGQDGDLMMLGLATHEPNLVLLRERVLFNMTKRKLMEASTTSLDAYIHNPHFEFLHLGVLRDYLAYEFEASNVLGGSPWDLEHTIDDFVFMTFFVGNDFLPHMPALDIGDNAFDLLFYSYKQCRTQWLEDSLSTGTLPYLTNAGSIVSGQRLQHFLSEVGAHEISYYDKKKQSASKENQRMRKESKRFGFASTVPSEDVLASKEASDRAAFRQMLQSIEEPSDDSKTSNAARDSSVHGFTPVVSGEVIFQPVEEELEEGLVSRMGSLLQNSLTNNTKDSARGKEGAIDDQDLKGRYYYDKFQLTPFDSQMHLKLRKSYIEGLVWNLKYYYEGCVSWEWYYPYHYGRYLLLSEILCGI